MFDRDSYSLLFKILEHWKEESERPPLVLNGLKENNWEELLREIISIFAGKSVDFSHPDILLLERDSKKQNIEVKQIRNFVSQMTLSFFEYDFKIGFIPYAQYLNVQSQNALLKTLEEPLSKRYLILGTDSKNKLLPTILSRSVVVNIGSHSESKNDLFDSEETLEFRNIYDKLASSTLPQRIMLGNKLSEGKTEKIKDFFVNAIIYLQKKILEEIENANKEKLTLKKELLKTALNYREQLDRTSGANPKLLFESFLLQIK